MDNNLQNYFKGPLDLSLWLPEKNNPKTVFERDLLQPTSVIQV